MISIEAAQEVSRLEVLTVSDSEFVIKDSGKSDPTISWLEVQGIGVFTVDLTACEFIADSERQYVLVGQVVGQTEIPVRCTVFRKPLVSSVSRSNTGSISSLISSANRQSVARVSK